MKAGKLLVVGTAVVSLTMLAACGSGTVGSSGSSGANTPDNKNLVLIPGVANEPFYISMQCGAQDEAKKLGYKLDTQPPAKFDPALQTPIVTGVLGSKPAGVLIAPTSDTALAAPMKQLKSAGIKVVEVDTALKDTSVALSSISSNNEQGGTKAGQTMADLLAGKTGSVLVLDTIAGTSTTAARAKGFADEIAKHPGLKALPVQFTNNDPAEAASKVTGTLASTPDLVGVFATNLNTGQGAATALRNANKAGKVQLIGFDASPNEVTDLKNGSFQALIAQDPATIGKDGVDQAVAAIEKKPNTRTISTDLVAITQKDMDSNSKYFYRAQC